MIVRTLFGYKASQCLYVAAKLNIADHLEQGDRTAEQLAKLTDTNPDALYRVLRCLAVLGIFQEKTDKLLSLNANAQSLLSSSDNSIKDFVILCGEELYQSAGDLLYSVKSGSPAFNNIYGMSHWQYLDEYPDKAEIFHNAMEVGSKNTIKEILKHYDFSSYSNIVDVGGGKGHLLAGILSTNTSSRGIVFDLENATQLAQTYITENSLSGRCDVVTGNFFDSIPSDGDLYLLKVILHDWDDQHALEILRNCRKAMSRNSKLLIIEKVIEDDKFKDLACLGDINMLVMYMGKERTIEEFEKLLNDANLKLTRKINTATAFSLIEVVTK